MCPDERSLNMRNNTRKLSVSSADMLNTGNKSANRAFEPTISFEKPEMANLREHQNQIFRYYGQIICTRVE